jgi:autophagy-related protein 101
MNCEEFTTPALDIQLSELKEALRCVVHTILFCRAVGGSKAVEPLTAHAPLFDISYARVDAPEFESKAESKIKALADGAESQQGSWPVHFVISFFTEKPSDNSKGIFWKVFGNSPEKMFFERWKIPVSVVSSRPASPSSSSNEGLASSQVKTIIWFILKKASEKMDHLPGTCASIIYPCDFSIEKSSSWSPRNLANSIKTIPYIT